MKQEIDYPPIGSYLMYPCYDEGNNLIGFSSDYEADGAFGKLCILECKGMYERIKQL